MQIIENIMLNDTPKMVHRSPERGMMIMVPTRNAVTEMIDTLNEEQLKKVAEYVSTVNEEDTVASAAEVAELTKQLNKKYEKTFRALAH